MAEQEVDIPLFHHTFQNDKLGDYVNEVRRRDRPRGRAAAPPRRRAMIAAAALAARGPETVRRLPRPTAPPPAPPPAPPCRSPSRRPWW
jgi:hypothetical protein